MIDDKQWKRLCYTAVDDLGLPRNTGIPAPETLAAALTESWMEPSIKEMIERLGKMLGVMDGPHKDSWPEGGFNHEYDEAIFAVFGLFNLPHASAEGQRAIASKGFPATAWFWLWLDEEERARVKHPLAPLIQAWLQRPEEIRPEIDKAGQPLRNGIMPEGLMPGRPAVLATKACADLEGDLLPELGRVEKSTEQLPLLAEIMADEDLPVAPLILANAAGFRGLQPGRGARLDKRVLVYSLLSMPIDQRRPGARYELRRPLRWWRDMLWPMRTGPGGRTLSSYRPTKHARALYSALEAVNLAKVIMPDGYTWRPVIVRGYPAFDDLDSPVITEIALPDGSDRGPSIDRPALIDAGTVSDPAFDLQLGLAYLWDEAKGRNGSRRVFALRPVVLSDGEGHIVDEAGKVIREKGLPATRWNHPRAVRTGQLERNPAADRVRVLDREGRRRLAYGSAGNRPDHQISRERKATDALLEGLEHEGRIVIERDAVDGRTGKRGWRIIEARSGNA